MLHIISKKSHLTAFIYSYSLNINAIYGGFVLKNLKINTLIKENNCKERWYPTSVDIYKQSFILDNEIEHADALRSNLSYNMQYLEFLEKEFDELKVSSVIETMLIKTYIITGMSILEGIFTNILKSNKLWKISKLESIGTTLSNKKNFSGEEYIIKTEILKEVEPYMLQMNLDELIKKLNRHQDILSVKHTIYPALKRLKDLRNRIHIQKAENRLDHDYNAFNFSEKKEMQNILYEILISPSITENPESFDFLKPNE